jgi:RimJ/RimL family protein N-acetyltransferase
VSVRSPGPAYRIHTRRLIIRCWDPRDAPLLSRALQQSAEHLKPWMLWAHDEPQSLEDRIRHLRQFRAKFDLGEDYVYGIFDQGETEVLGATGLHTRVGPRAREIGYWIHQDHTDQGLATESSSALVKVAFEIDSVNRVEIHCDPRNVRSAAIPRNLGFSHEATLRQRRPFLEQWHDAMIWTLFAQEYPETPSARTEIEAYDAIGRRIL